MEMKKIIISSLTIALVAGAANAMPGPMPMQPHNKPGVIVQNTGPAMRAPMRPSVAPRPVVVVRNVQPKPQPHYNHGCTHGCSKCHTAGNNNGLATALTIGLVTGGVLYALAK